ncbi:MAG: hypothetical protein R3B09_24215, partial [Nannocystaceae bacterium]
MRRLLASAGLLVACHGPMAASSTSTSTTTGDDSTSTADGPGTSLTTGASGSASSGTDTGSTGSTSSTQAGDPTTDDPSTTASSTTDDTDTDTSTSAGAESCKKVDILFLINDGGELWDTASALKKLMPHLAKRLEGDFADWDYHLMVIRGNDTWGSAYCDQKCAEETPCGSDPPYPCDYEPTLCDRTLGSGLTFPAGAAHASNVPCPIDGDRRYLVNGQSDLAGTLECLRQVGGGNGMATIPVARATLDALGTTLNAPGACNDGFLRDDAYLLLFLLSPFPDFLSDGTSELWTEELKAHKGGKFDKIYFVGL